MKRKSRDAREKDEPEGDEKESRRSGGWQWCGGRSRSRSPGVTGESLRAKLLFRGSMGVACYVSRWRGAFRARRPIYFR